MSTFDQEITRTVGVVLSRRVIQHAWADVVWSPDNVLFPAPDTPAGTKISDDGERALIYAGTTTIELFASDTTNYRDNMLEGSARLWVAARLENDVPSFVRVTADPTEGEAWFAAGFEIVGAIPMPADIASWIAAFTDAFHVEREFLKRQRDRSERQGDRARGFGGKPGDRRP